MSLQLPVWRLLFSRARGEERGEGGTGEMRKGWEGEEGERDMNLHLKIHRKKICIFVILIKMQFFNSYENFRY